MDAGCGMRERGCLMREEGGGRGEEGGGRRRAGGGPTYISLQRCGSPLNHGDAEVWGGGQVAVSGERYIDIRQYTVSHTMSGCALDTH